VDKTEKTVDKRVRLWKTGQKYENNNMGKILSYPHIWGYVFTASEIYHFEIKQWKPRRNYSLFSTDPSGQLLVE